jgi:hypothetical protein
VKYSELRLVSPISKLGLTGRALALREDKRKKIKVEEKRDNMLQMPIFCPGFLFVFYLD